MLLPRIFMPQVSEGGCEWSCQFNAYFVLVGESLDEMQLLEEQARRIAEEAARDQPKKPKSMTFVK